MKWVGGGNREKRETGNSLSSAAFHIGGIVDFELCSFYFSAFSSNFNFPM